MTLGRAGGPASVQLAGDLGTDEGVDSARLGLALRPLSRDERVQARIDQALLVQGVQGAAARAGLTQGDVVLAINGQPVGRVDELRRVLSTQPRSVALLIWRSGERLFVPVPLG